MDIEKVREFCLGLPGVTEDMPYGSDIVVMRIEGKIFIHFWLDAPLPTIAVKLPPEKGEMLREAYNSINPAWHLNKRHWNDIWIEHGFSDELITGWITESYRLVLSSLPKATRERYQNMLLEPHKNSDGQITV